MLLLNAIKTNQGYFISDCNTSPEKEYDWNYHNSEIKDLLLDDKKAIPSFYKNWWMIDDYPKTIKKVEKKNINRHYKLKDESLVSSVLPMIIAIEDKDKYNEDIFSLYTYYYDTIDDVINIDFEIHLVLEIQDYKISPVFNYNAAKTNKQYYTNSNNHEYTITNADIKHQLLDKIIFPEIMLVDKPCCLSSVQFYSIIRQHVRDNINVQYARITSDYDFCFVVNKIITLLKPKEVSYQQLFARTKKEREKIQHKIVKTEEICVFEMTNRVDKYQKYTVLPDLIAPNEHELKTKLDNFLESLMYIINKPVEQCEHCNGTGLKIEVEKFDTKEALL